MFGYIKIRLAVPFIIAVSEAVLSHDHSEVQLSLICAAFGVLGGGMLQLLTWDDRKPTWRYMLGDLLASGVSGFGVFAFMGYQNVATFFYSICAGFGGSTVFVAATKKYLPAWLPTNEGDK